MFLPEGELNPLTSATADPAGIDEIYRAGDTQVAAALAYGAETIPVAVKIAGRVMPDCCCEMSGAWHARN